MDASVTIESNHTAAELRLARDGGSPARTTSEWPMFPGGMEVGREELDALERVVRSKNLFRYYGVGAGPHEVADFEREFAAYVGAKHALCVNAGSSALICGLIGAGVGPGDEVIVPAYTWNATPNAVLVSGALPVLAEVDESLTLDPADVERKLTPRTKAILPVHLFGRPAALGELAALGVPLVEDAAQAFGAPGIATTGVASTFSFYPTKNLGALGDGGLVAVTDEELGERIRLLRFHGSRDKRDFQLVGFNSRLDELQAAALRVFLPHVAEWNRLRREAALRYSELGLGELVELPPDDGRHVYHLFVVRTPERDRVRAALEEAGIGCASYYVTPLHLQPALAYLGYEPGSLPETERASRENLALPLWPGIERAAQERVVEVVRSAVRERVAS
jgi:dTDP-4-amino-4,6-dideoxygalactose transaminase